ncbi:hypothetical protein OS493_024982 [Desmophyllum pertusum]|uniref:Uncharacterized protein n=1 Tax=Desmophyllum pertusum TaxID=174260 RepID=A0A9X0CIX7_9CNID|nr:hypothetical protein OS493_024982 [Desmophyllum pertusum]
MKHPCQNGATCSPIYNEDDYNCTCAPGYIGRHCGLGQIVICESETGQRLSCGDRGTINVLSANYGRLDTHTCSDEYQTTNCRAENSLARVKERCQGNAHCELTASSEFFGGDPCLNTLKYLLVTYRCES